MSTRVILLDQFGIDIPTITAVVITVLAIILTCDLHVSDHLMTNHSVYDHFDGDD